MGRGRPVSDSPGYTTDRVEPRPSPRHGIGVFAKQPIAMGDVVEHCPVLVLEPEDARFATEGSLSGYVYDWEDGRTAVALGCGSLYNHDPDPSAHYRTGDDGQSLVILARRDIAAGEEITIDYTGGGAIDLWFDLD